MQQLGSDGNNDSYRGLLQCRFVKRHTYALYEIRDHDVARYSPNGHNIDSNNDSKHLFKLLLPSSNLTPKGLQAVSEGLPLAPCSQASLLAFWITFPLSKALFMGPQH